MAQSYARKLEIIEALLVEILERLPASGVVLDQPGPEDLKRALVAMSHGDMGPLELYKMRGGKILPAEELGLGGVTAGMKTYRPKAKSGDGKASNVRMVPG